MLITIGSIIATIVSIIALAVLVLMFKDANGTDYDNDNYD